MTTNIDDLEKRITSQKSSGQEDTQGIPKEGFADASGEYPNREYFFGTSINKSAKGEKVNELFSGGGDYGVETPLADQKPSQYPFESVYIEYQRKLTEETQARIYPDNWIMEFVEGQGNNFEWGWDIYQCGVQQAYIILKGEKYLPLICLGDFYEAEGLGYGFSRTESLGFGGKKCTHRFVKQSKAPKAWPPYDLEEFNKDFWSE